MPLERVTIEQHEFKDVLEITATGWDGRILKMSRQTYYDWRAKYADSLKTALVYVLYADHFERREPAHKMIYVGQTEDPVVRGGTHDRLKDDWTTTLLFTSAGDWMNSAHAKRIEYQFIRLSKEASRYESANGNDGGPGLLGSEDHLRVEAYVELAPKVLRFAGIDIFEPNPAGIFTLTEKERRHRASSKASLRIVEGAPGRIVEILSGSTLFVSLVGYYKQKIDDLVKVNSADFDQDSRLLTFKRDVQYQLGADERSVFGSLLSNWLNTNRKPLSAAFAGLAAVSPATSVEAAVDGESASSSHADDQPSLAPESDIPKSPDA